MAEIDTGDIWEATIFADEFDEDDEPIIEDIFLIAGKQVLLDSIKLWWTLPQQLVIDDEGDFIYVRTHAGGDPMITVCRRKLRTEPFPLTAKSAAQS